MERLTIGLLILLCLFSCNISNNRIEPLILSEIKQIFIKDSTIYLSRIQGIQKRSTIVQVVDSNKVQNLGYLPNNYWKSILWEKTKKTFVIMLEQDNVEIDTTTYKVSNLYFKNQQLEMKTNIGWIDFDSYQIKNDSLYIYNDYEFLNHENINNIIFQTNKSNLICFFNKKEYLIDVTCYKFKNGDIDKIKKEILRTYINRF